MYWYKILNNKDNDEIIKEAKESKNEKIIKLEKILAQL